MAMINNNNNERKERDYNKKEKLFDIYRNPQNLYSWQFRINEWKYRKFSIQESFARVKKNLT